MLQTPRIQSKHNKLTTPYNSVTKVKGSMVTTAKNGHFMVRNSSFFKKIAPELLDIPPDPDDDNCDNSDAPYDHNNAKLRDGLAFVSSQKVH
eukprot:superscaffoldBa00000872_g7728